MRRPERRASSPPHTVRRFLNWKARLWKNRRATTVEGGPLNGMSGRDARREEPPASLHTNYQLGDLIEKGPLSTVHRAVHRHTSKLYAIKTIDIGRFCRNTGLSSEDVSSLVSLCAQLRHPFIAELRDVIATGKDVHLVYDLLQGDDLCFEVVLRAANGFVYSEAVSSHYMKQLLQALEYIHSQGIVHRDIRPHNIVLASKDNSAPLKLCGFGVAMRLPSPDATVAAGIVGVPHFMAPEVAANQEYGSKADLWSVGVLLYLLLSGRLPFVGSLQQIQHVLKEGQFGEAMRLSGGTWNEISEAAKDLVSRLLQPDPHKRFSASEALNHEWLKEKDRSAPRRHLQHTVDLMRKYNSGRRLKSSILRAVNAEKWDWSSATATFATGDSLPGGDTCDVDGCQPAPRSSSSTSRDCPRELQAVEKILSSLDQIAALSTPPLDARGGNAILDVINDQQFRGLLQLYDKIAQSTSQPLVFDTDAALITKEITSFIDTLLAPSAEAQELRNLLNSQHLKALLQAHDVVIHEVYEGSERDEGAVSGPSSQTPPPPFSYLNGGVLPLGSHAAGTSTDGGMTLPTSAFEDDDDLLADSVSRIRLVQFQKDTEEPMGITLKVTEDGRCVVARIMHGGMIHRQATLHVGDEIREINGCSVAQRSVESLQQLLRDARGPVTFKIVPSYRSAPPACEIFVRAQFDYDPLQDDLIPCPQAGVPFKTGDILQVISKDDHNWWQARFVSAFPSLGGFQAQSSTAGQAVAGLIPSPELQEWRTACLAMERAKDQSHCMWFNKKKKYYTTKYLQKHSALFDQLDLVTYEEVMRLPQYRRKTLVLLGAHGVGRRHIKNTLIHRHPQRFAYPIPHTTRPPRKDEVDGKHYFFVTNDTMLADIQANEYLEYGTHEECMYGTKLETIRNIHRTGKIAILDVEPQALKVLRTAEYSPFVVFVAAPNLQGLQDPDGSLERLLKESEMLRQAFGHLFDYVILNNDIDETIAQLERIVEKLNACPQWLPVSWVY